MKLKTTFTLPNFERANPNNRLKQIIFDADLRNGHDGLTDLAKANRVNPNELDVGEFILFVNASQTACKFFASGSRALGHFKMPGHSRMPLMVFKYLPQYFNGGELNYKGALRELITSSMKKT